MTKTFNERVLFRELNISLSDVDRIGLIGANGSGKSTLLKIFSRLESADSGDVAINKNCRMVYLPQEEVLDADASVWDIVFASLADQDHDASERQVRTQRALTRAGFTDHEQRVGTLSGGWNKRLSLTKALVQEPSLLLLDEPSNHLDLDGVLWLEALLAQASFAFVLVTHDRYFLQQCCNCIVEISRRYTDGYLRVDGDYSDFLQQRQLQLEQQTKQHVALATKVKREVEWLHCSPKARTTKARSRIDEAQRLQHELHEANERNAKDRSVRIDFDSTGRKSKKLLYGHELSYSFGERTLFNDVNIMLSPGKRLGLLGGNGVGKSTLLKILARRLLPSQGRLEFAEGVRVLYFEQDRSSLNGDLSLRHALSPDTDTIIYRGQAQHIVGWAARFLFRPEQLDMPVASLSGGEQARILLARFMLQPADVLLLDEPTNDLDIPALEVLEASLMDFPGAIVLVSHDRYLLDRVCEGVIGIDGQGGAHYCADHLQWLRIVADTRKAKTTSVKKTRVQQAKTVRLTYAEQRELDHIEEDIADAEATLHRCEGRVQDGDVTSNPLVLRECVAELEQAQLHLDALIARWEELETKKAESDAARVRPTSG